MIWGLGTAGSREDESLMMSDLGEREARAKSDLGERQRHRVRERKK